MFAHLGHGIAPPAHLQNAQSGISIIAYFYHVHRAHTHKPNLGRTACLTHTPRFIVRAVAGYATRIEHHERAIILQKPNFTNMEPRACLRSELAYPALLVFILIPNQQYATPAIKPRIFY
jgi:hypothetical protein